MRHAILCLVLSCVLANPLLAGRAQEGGPKYTDGTEVACDLPLQEWIKNVGGRDGAGLCVFTSIEHSARWQNCEALRGFQQKMRAEMGGGYPEKVDRMMKKYAPGAKYIQYSGKDPAVLDLAIKTGRMPAVTYGYSERYGGRVAHMVSLVHLDDKIACVLDNNFIGQDRLEWMDRPEFLRRWKLGGGGWCIILLDPGPPPIPINQSGGQEKCQKILAGESAANWVCAAPVAQQMTPAPLCAGFALIVTLIVLGASAKNLPGRAGANMARVKK